MDNNQRTDTNNDSAGGKQTSDSEFGPLLLTRYALHPKETGASALSGELGYVPIRATSSSAISNNKPATLPKPTAAMVPNSRPRPASPCVPATVSTSAPTPISTAAKPSPRPNLNASAKQKILATAQRAYNHAHMQANTDIVDERKQNFLGLLR